MKVWKDIKGLEGKYQVSNDGEVRSLTHKDSRGHTYYGRILSQIHTNGYLQVHLSNGKTAKYYLVHRLVAEAFCEKPDGCDIVNHLDCNTENNRADNLEWTTYEGNMQWASKLGRMPANEQAYKNIASGREKRKTEVIATDKDGKDYYFKSQADAAKSLGISRNHISQACRKEYGYKTISGYSFRYADEEKQKTAIPKRVGKSKEELSEEKRQRMIGNKIMVGRKLSEQTKKKLAAVSSKPVCKYSLDGEFLEEYPSARYIRRTTGLVIDSCLSGKTKTAGGFKWKYKENENG